MKSKKTTKASQPALLWNERGQIGCELPGHAPHRGSDTYYFERWRRIRPAEAAEFARDLGYAPRCESCAADELEEEEAARG